MTAIENNNHMNNVICDWILIQMPFEFLDYFWDNDK